MGKGAKNFHFFGAINLVLLLLLALISTANSFEVETPTLTFLTTTLPTLRDGATAVYDGDDAIYVIGGFNENDVGICNHDVLKFTISTTEIQLFAQTPKPVCFGQGFLDAATKSIYFFGEDPELVLPNKTTLALRINLEAETVEQVGSIDNRGNPFSAIFDEKSRNVYIIGGSSAVGDTTDREILKYDLATNTHEIIGEVPDTSLYSPVSISFVDTLGVALVMAEGNAYRFTPLSSACDGTVIEPIFEIPFDIIRGQIVYSKHHSRGFIVGGSDASYDLLEVNPSTFEFKSHRIPEFPVALVDSGSAYVESLNRIYFFGGYSKAEDIYLNGIGVLQFGN